MRYPHKLPIERGRIVIQQRKQQVLLLLEIPIERALARTSLNANIIDGEVSKATYRRAPPRRVNQRPATLNTSLRTNLRHSDAPNIQTDSSVSMQFSTSLPSMSFRVCLMNGGSAGAGRHPTTLWRACGGSWRTKSKPNPECQ